MFKSLWAKSPIQYANKNLQRIDADIDGLSVQWRKSKRRKRSLSLKVDKRGEVIVMTPMRTTQGEMRRFVQTRRQWISQQLNRYEALKTKKLGALGETIFWQGEQFDIRFQLGAKNHIAFDLDVLVVVGRRVLSKEKLDLRVKKWLRKQAEAVLPERLTLISKQADLHANGYKIKPYTARWGSCRHDGLIQLNWKLIMTPPDVIDYVIIHELCHLKHFDHSPKFWAHVELNCPEYQVHRLWLKRHGQLLIEA